MRHSTEGRRVGAALGKFDSGDSNKKFLQMAANVKVREKNMRI